MAAAGLLTLPLGVYVLISLDEDLMRRAVAAIAILLSLLLLSGWRYRGPRGGVAAGVAGTLGGFLNGAVSIGGPPIIFYLLSGPDDAATNRAHFISYATIIQAFALTVFIWNGSVTTDLTLSSFAMAIPYALATWAGIHLFKHASEDLFRRVALGVMLAVSIIVVVI